VDVVLDDCCVDEIDEFDENADDEVDEAYEVADDEDVGRD